MGKNNAVERQHVNIRLNGTALQSIGKAGKLTFLTVPHTVENTLILEDGGSVKRWTFSITPRTKTIKIRGLHRPLKHQGVMQLLNPTEVFACENGTLLFHQHENFTLAIGHTKRLPVKLESRSTSMLLISWVDQRPAEPDVPSSHTVTLYRTELDSYNMQGMDSTTHNHYRFTALDSCSKYVACVEIAGTHSLSCISTITDPDVPKFFHVTTWNTSHISVTWDCPNNLKLSLFLLTVFFLNGTDHITEELLFWHQEGDLVFTLSDLPPCSRVNFGLQTVCQAGVESRYSNMVLIDGNSVHSRIEALRQTLFGPNNYTLNWEVRNASSISVFRVYHEGVLHGTTFITSYTVGGLLPCGRYQVKVEALCGNGVVMNVKTIVAYTGPPGVFELTHPSDDVTAPLGLSFMNITTVQNGHLTQPELEDRTMNVLDVWEECVDQWQLKTSAGFLVQIHSSNGDLQELTSSSLTLVVPWPLSEALQDESSEPRAGMEKIVKNKLQDLLEGFDGPVHIDLVGFEPAGETYKTEIVFASFNGSKTEAVPLSVKDQLDYIQSLNRSDITVANGIIYWDGPDLCLSSNKTLCPPNSLCINTLGSYTCLCKHGFYDVSATLKPPAGSHPVCKEKGLFSQCRDKVMTGGIAKPYLMSYVGGKVDVVLNDGRCLPGENEMFYYFNMSRETSDYGTRRQVNKTHIVFQNTLTVTLSEDQTISRRDLKVIWKCIYPRHYVHNAKVNVDLEWLISFSVVELNSSLELSLSMTLYSNVSYTHQYQDTVVLGHGDTLFLQVALLTNSSFAADVVLQVESCWATESTDPQDTVQGIFLQDGCPVDSTFHWLSINGNEQKSRFSIHMFNMPKGLPIYFHCLAHICGHHEDCTKNCSHQQRTKRSTSKMDAPSQQGTIVSAGPLVVIGRAESRGGASHWADHMMMIFVISGSIGFLGLTLLCISATKAVMSYYEQLRIQ
ncbi:uncharacterized protein LOC117504462 [Thalassophryne amazonica]|uniref:uncharacterized protein LOC117504462 n=1 Tax=Thalassophryne amazonica TaxID=390379 RepID=UPI0014722728|nr:uncharacterized protein LOC117504462 [Thalassophryne amazonica]